MTRVLSDRYELGRLVGAGGSAQVYAARDLLLDRVVAVKMLDSSAAASNDPAGRDRFLAEARSSASFTHSGAVSVYDAGEADGDLFIVMEMVDGTSLAHEIASRAPMPESEAVRIGAELLDALDAAHGVGIVHRDVKPANILLAGTGAVKLADFGIAKRFDDMAASLTTVGTVIGTPRYLAPEQAAGKPTTPAVDVYAVGVVLHEMLTGAPPSAAPDLRAARPDVSPAVGDAIAQALAPDPANRFESAADMATALRGEPLSAPLITGDRIHAATRVMVQSGAPTQVLDPAPAPAVPIVAAAPTAVIQSFGPAPTELAPTPAESDPFRRHDPARRTPAQRDHVPRWWVASLVVIVMVGVATLALAQRDPLHLDSAPENLAAAAEMPTDSPENDTIEPGSEVPQDPTATLSVGEQPPDAGVAAPPPFEELIPGFAATDDIIVFIAQLREGKDVVGKQSKKLGNELHKLLVEDEDDRADAAADLTDDVRKWVEKGELDPVVAAAALEFLEPLG